MLIIILSKVITLDVSLPPLDNTNLYLLLYLCHGSRHEPEYNILNGVVIEEGYVRVTMRV